MSEPKTKPLRVNANTIALLKLEPENISVRALVANQMGKPIPAELTTYSAILKWIEKEPPTPEVVKPFVFGVIRSDIEEGSCIYRVTRQGTAQFILTPDEVVEWATQADTIGALWDIIYEHISEWADDNIAPRWTDEVSNTDDHEPNNYRDKSTEYSSRDVHGAVRTMLKQVVPAEYARLFGNDDE